MYREKGFTYIWMLFAVALAGIVLAGAGQLWHHESWRDKEKELMFAGDQFRQAISSYYESSPGIPKYYPDSLEKLLADDRFPIVKRHLRKIFFDPMTGTTKWGLIRQPGTGITGVYSLSTQQTIKRANFSERYKSFTGAVSYKDWRFVYAPEVAGSISTQPQPPIRTNSKSYVESQSPVPGDSPSTGGAALLFPH